MSVVKVADYYTFERLPRTVTSYEVWGWVRHVRMSDGSGWDEYPAHNGYPL